MVLCPIVAPSVGFAQAVNVQASAAVRATATVVPSIGITSPEDNSITLSDQSIGFREIVEDGKGRTALSVHRLLVRFPALTSTSVSLETAAGHKDYFTLAEYDDGHTRIFAGNSSRQGAMLLDLCDVCSEITDADGHLVVTLIYTEN